MKLLNKVLHILAVAGSVAAIVFLFFSFADVTNAAGTESSIAGSLMLFRSSLADGTKMATSSKLVFVMMLNLIALIYSALSFGKKFKSTRFIAAGFALANAIYTLVYVCKTPKAFLDLRTVDAVSISYGTGLYLMFAAICLAAVAGIAYLFLDDYIIAKETGSATITKKVITFLKDYKSEIHKIVWPDVKTVVKNTIIVLIICGLVGIFVWLADFGLSKLLELL